NGRLSPFNYVARPYPSLPTDAQPIFAVLASQCEGLSKIRDTVFPHRFGYLSQLAKFGLKSIQKRNYVIIDPDSKLQPAKVSCQDIRSAASLLICALMCSGESFLEEAHHLRRGYDSIDIKLRALGADVYFTDVKMDSPKN
ncbi:MAG: UDP-N-acetylglucosamine 1-carboxyvinyltransferase, partial [Deltaproteobacteria bacterium]|nr:UDP-N-acetylglucosamine 1-carboxyvinyltransferase [Deltaproteobacteria bacterium]